MTSELIIFALGLILFLLAIADSFIKRGTSTGLMNTKLRIPFGVIGILLIIYSGFSYGVDLPAPLERVEAGDKKEITYPVTSVQLISPLDGDTVNCRILTTGVYPENHSKDIWVLLKPSDDKYYPQSDETNTSYKLNGQWQVITRFGGDIGEQFDLIVYEAEPRASQFFSSTIEKWNQERQFPGIEEDELPEGITEVDRVQVFLRDNCRGAHENFSE